MSIDLRGIGATSSSQPFAVTRDHMIAYARATNDTNPAHLEGRYAPPLYALFPAMRTMARLVRSNVTEDFLFHGEHDIRFHRPILPGQTLVSAAHVVGIIPRGVGTQIVAEGETHDSAGNLICEHVLVNLAPNVTVGQTLGRAAPDHRMPSEIAGRAPDALVSQPLTADQTRRYAQASDDWSAYTYDAEAARAIGLSGPIVHGVCTMAFFSHAVVSAFCGGDSPRLKRLAVRFSAPLAMRENQRLETSLWQRSASGAVHTIVGEARDSDGLRVLSNGWAEISA